jgi:hypothetical protein
MPGNDGTIRRLAVIPVLVALLVPAGCATFNRQPLDHEVTIDVTNNQPTSGDLTIWLYYLGRHERLGTVPPGETRAFSYELQVRGSYVLMAYRPGFTDNPSRDSSAPTGQLVARSEPFPMSEDIGRVHWETRTDFVTVN